MRTRNSDGPLTVVLAGRGSSSAAPAPELPEASYAVPLAAVLVLTGRVWLLRRRPRG